MNKLIIDPATGMAGDMFVAALAGLGVPAEGLAEVMHAAARPIGGAAVCILPEPPHDSALAWSVSARLLSERAPLVMDEAVTALTRVLRGASITGFYASFALAALDILAHAEGHAHGGGGHCHEPWHEPVQLHEAQDIIMDLSAAAWGLQRLAVAMETVVCYSPVSVGGGRVRFSHGEFDVPAPATAEILKHHRIPWEGGPCEFEQLTPTGAAILAALNPLYVPRQPLNAAFRRGIGLGTKRTDPPNALVLALAEGISPIPGG